MMILALPNTIMSFSLPPLDPLLFRNSGSPASSSYANRLPSISSLTGQGSTMYDLTLAPLHRPFTCSVTSQPLSDSRRALTLSQVPAQSQAYPTAVPRRAFSLSAASSSPTSAQVYAKLYETLVERWSEQAKVVAAHAPESKVEAWLQGVSKIGSRKRSMDNDAPDEASNDAARSPKKMKAVDDGLHTIDEEESESPEPPPADLPRRPSSAPPLLFSASPTTMCADELDSNMASPQPIKLPSPAEDLPRRAESPIIRCRNAPASRRPSTSDASVLRQPLSGPRRTNPRRSEGLLCVMKSFEKVLETRAEGWRLLASEESKTARRRSAP